MQRIRDEENERRLCVVVVVVGQSHCLEFVQIVAELGHLVLQTLALAHGEDEVLSLARIHGTAALQVLPMREDHLRESLTGGGGTERGGETEGLGHGQMALDLDERSAFTLDGLEDDTTTDVQGGVDTGGGVLGAGNLDQEDGLLKSGLGGHHRGEADTTHRRHDLTSTTMDGIGMHGDVHDVELDTTHVLLAQRSLLGGPLEGGIDVLLDLVEVLDTDGLVDNNIGTIGLRAEAPDLEGVVFVPLELLAPELGTLLGIGLGTVDLAFLFDLRAQVQVERLGGEVQTIVLVGGLGETGFVGQFGAGLTVGHNGIGLDERDAGEIFLKILKADLNVQLTATGDDVLTRFLDLA